MSPITTYQTGVAVTASQSLQSISGGTSFIIVNHGYVGSLVGGDSEPNLVFYRWGEYCDVCGWRYPAGELKRRWDGLNVCDKDWETRHPQDLIRTKKEIPTPPYSEPQIEIEISPTYIVTGVQENSIPTGTNNNEL